MRAAFVRSALSILTGCGGSGTSSTPPAAQTINTLIPVNSGWTFVTVVGVNVHGRICGLGLNTERYTRHCDSELVFAAVMFYTIHTTQTVQTARFKGALGCMRIGFLTQELRM
jgi:hypothetical protein